jgi:hypothetical protein
VLYLCDTRRYPKTTGKRQIEATYRGTSIFRAVSVGGAIAVMVAPKIIIHAPDPVGSKPLNLKPYIVKHKKINKATITDDFDTSVGVHPLESESQGPNLILPLGAVLAIAS